MSTTGADVKNCNRFGFLGPTLVYSHPPLGLDLYLGSLRFQRPITQLFRASLPFLVILLVELALITYIPDLSLGLVGLLGYADLPVLRR
jgi:hypothetical protein